MGRSANAITHASIRVRDRGISAASRVGGDAKKSAPPRGSGLFVTAAPPAASMSLALGTDGSPPDGAGSKQLGPVVRCLGISAPRRSNLSGRSTGVFQRRASGRKATRYETTGGTVSPRNLASGPGFQDLAYGLLVLPGFVRMGEGRGNSLSVKTLAHRLVRRYLSTIFRACSD